jgi:hypothetical protein
MAENLASTEKRKEEIKVTHNSTAQMAMAIW